jgi:predicted 2-oxoglutarate/Fe(II)-dependent dioxygenase YbiX
LESSARATTTTTTNTKQKQDTKGMTTLGAAAESDRTTYVEEIDVSKWAGPGKFAIVIHNVFTPDECEALIARAEENGFDQALVNVGNGRQVAMTDVRNSDRSIIDDPVFAEELWQRIRHATNDDPRLMQREGNKIFNALGLNERLRFLRYDKGNYFASHQDGCYIRGLEAGEERRGEVSKVTCQLYLNEGFEGGATRFMDWDDSRGIDVVPRTGSVLLFEHPLLHEGSVLLSGRKYAIRTDVMYTNRPDYRERTYAASRITIPAPLNSTQSSDGSVMHAEPPVEDPGVSASH